MPRALPPHHRFKHDRPTKPLPRLCRLVTEAMGGGNPGASANVGIYGCLTPARSAYGLFRPTTRVKLQSRERVVRVWGQLAMCLIAGRTEMSAHQMGHVLDIRGLTGSLKSTMSTSRH